MEAAMAAPILDDRRHALLAKAHPLRQARLGAFAGGAAAFRDRIGAARVLEVEVKTALTPCGVRGEPWSLNPYVGCAHACGYCYVPSVQRVERDRWGSYVVVKRNLPSVLAQELRHKERRPVFLSSATDPYQAAEHQHEVTRRCLEQLVRVDWPLQVLTRSPLVTRDIDLLKRFSDVEVGLSVPTLDEAVARAVEPGAPSIATRLKALAQLHDADLATYAHLMPAYPFTGGWGPAEAAEAFRATGVDVVHAGPLRYLDAVLPVLRRRVEPDTFAAFERAARDPSYYVRMFRALRVAFRRAGVALRAG